jgi:hypothetical protein
MTAYLWEAPKHFPEQRFLLNIEIRGSGPSVSLEVNSDYLALYVVLSTAVPGHFSDNAFHVRPGDRKVVVFEPFYQLDLDLFTRTLRAQHLGSDEMVVNFVTATNTNF